MTINKNFVKFEPDRLTAEILVPSRTIELGQGIKIIVPDEMSTFYTGLVIGLALGQQGKTVLGEDVVCSSTSLKDRLRFTSPLRPVPEHHRQSLLKELMVCGMEVSWPDDL